VWGTRHDSQPPRFRKLALLLLHPPIAPWCVANADGLDLVLLCDQALPAGSVRVRSLPDNEELFTTMHPDGQHAALHRWRAHIAWDGGHHLTLYAFVVVGAKDAAGTRMPPLWWAADGPHALVPPESAHFRVHRSERPPAWVSQQVFYQVFPDRFARSSTATPDASLVPWGAPVPKRDAASHFYGGDLAGVVEQLPYLHDELGVTALYLNPIFSSRSNHRYDTTDYSHVDARLGGDAALLALRQATQARGMRLVLDAVVNHTGADHRWLQQQPSLYARDDHGRTLGWKGHASLPVLDFAQAAVQQAIYAAPDAVLRHWLRPPFAIDGWRLDVIHMLGEGPGALNNAHHVRAVRQAVREENPEAYLLGEHFSEATRWLQGDQEDGAMNYYGFTTPLWAWLAGVDVGQPLSEPKSRISTAQLDTRMTQAMAPLPYANQLAQLNLLGSHDTVRMLTQLGGDVELMQVAFTLLFTRPGVPCLYYGDEIGTPGGADPDCRRCFDWDRNHWQPALWAHAQQLAQQRRTRSEWQRGAAVTLAQGADWWAYARFDEHAATVVVVNRGSAVDVQVPVHVLPLTPRRWQRLGGTNVPITVTRTLTRTSTGTGTGTGTRTGATADASATLHLHVPAHGSCCVLSLP
jgi:alpha-glucosidase